MGPDLLGEGAAIGVRLFFALSGFLITGILMDTRSAIRSGATSTGTALLRFYARRSLRIFPLYFLVVGVAWAVGVTAVRHAPSAFLTFTYNHHLIRQGWFDIHVGHFWSLSVEQQFYLVWPCVVLFAPEWAIVPAAAAMVLGAEGTRYYYLHHETAGIGYYVSTLASGDALGVGALLAIAARRTNLHAVLERLFTPARIGLSCALLALGAWWQPLLVPVAGFGAELTYDLVELSAFAGLLHGAAHGFPGAAGALLSWRPMAYLGKISYGLYILHPLMLPVATMLLGVAGDAADGPAAARAAVALGLSLGTAALSWQAFEKPLNDLKRYF
jgi:peptidoglycan/LPS O-acetylase OafA/YrhL